MYPLQDKDLDRLSREAAEQFEVEHGASGWDHLEKRLDQELPQKKDRRRFLFWLFFISIATGGTLVAILINKVPATTSLAKTEVTISSPADKTTAANTTTEINNSNTSNEETAVKPDATVKNNTTDNPHTVTDKTQPVQNSQPVQNNQPVVTQHTIAQQATPDNQKATSIGNKAFGSKKTKSTPATDQQPIDLNYAITGSDNNPLNNNRNKYRQPKQKQGQVQRPANNQAAQSMPGNDLNATSGNDIASNSPVTGQTKAAEPVDKNDASAANSTNNTPAPVTATDKNTTAPAAADSTAKPAAAQQPNKKEEPKKPHNYKQPLEIGVLAGPDASTVAFGSLYKTGFNFGLQVGYRFNNRWSVNSAIIYTKKFYKADSQYFHPKNNVALWKPDNVNGNCYMWEIPVNVRYDIAYNDKRRWFASTGLSTYLMTKEDYTLNFRGPNGIYYSWPYKSDSNSNYIFSIINLSVGFERSLGKHFSIQAEPYLKIPMTGLGYGNMKMDSYGMLFSLKYKPTFRSKK